MSAIEGFWHVFGAVLMLIHTADIVCFGPQFGPREEPNKGPRATTQAHPLPPFDSKPDPLMCLDMCLDMCLCICLGVYLVMAEAGQASLADASACFEWAGRFSSVLLVLLHFPIP